MRSTLDDLVMKRTVRPNLNYEFIYHNRSQHLHLKESTTRAKLSNVKLSCHRIIIVKSNGLEDEEPNGLFHRTSSLVLNFKLQL